MFDDHSKIPLNTVLLKIVLRGLWYHHLFKVDINFQALMGMRADCRLQFAYCQSHYESKGKSARIFFPVRVCVLKRGGGEHSVHFKTIVDFI